ncbi:DUF1847 domain-containing protein [uncultured Methanospirillum sp.]|uniref:DUF1847 domain-containing protein n=1 Tax=uncultured Methanospirillum sp. TaxID=262503 RepID=UPI0029C96102|nr:DUF1847 domain-containing protein [uncultured Methanospirillum sp.]
MPEQHQDCSNCHIQACYSQTPDNGPQFCPTKTKQSSIRAALDLYKSDPDIKKMAITAARTEGRSYMKWTRVEDTIDFAREMGYRKIGIATCLGLMEEDRILQKILMVHGFNVVSVCCKCGAIPKEEIGLLDNEKAKPGTFEPICNPVAQAKILEEAGTDLNILLGLCVGHDTLFTKYSRAPVTTLVAKDRITCHNPNAVLHGTGFYYMRLLQP